MADINNAPQAPQKGRDGAPTKFQRKSDFYRKPHKKTCYFTDNHISYIDFRDVDVLKKFISDKGKILPRRFTGTKAHYQKHLAIAIKRARHMALLPFVEE